MYFLIITLGFVLAMRGAKPAPMQNPGEGLRRICREAADFFLTTSLILTLETLAEAFEITQGVAREYTILGLGLAAYLLSRYQKKTDAFFLCILASVFMISSKQNDLEREIFWAGVVSAGIALFQACFLGL
ncbi:MAG: hypothetical protein PHV97_00830 [Candidatus Omnitrophica bacterium]|nr:hypothetical protein [Candidatus Omnitrophota bacterium]